MLDALCRLNREHDPLPNVPMKSQPPLHISELFYKDTNQVRQINDLTREAQKFDLDLNWDIADEMVTTQRVNRVNAFRDVYVNAFDLPFTPSDYQRLVRNKALQLMDEKNAKPDVILRATELLGKTAPVQAFTESKTLNINMNRPEAELRDALKQQISALITSIS